MTDCNIRIDSAASAFAFSLPSQRAASPHAASTRFSPRRDPAPPHGSHFRSLPAHQDLPDLRVVARFWSSILSPPAHMEAPMRASPPPSMSPDAAWDARAWDAGEGARPNPRGSHVRSSGSPEAEVHKEVAVGVAQREREVRRTHDLCGRGHRCGRGLASACECHWLVAHL